MNSGYELNNPSTKEQENHKTMKAFIINDIIDNMVFTESMLNDGRFIYEQQLEKDLKYLTDPSLVALYKTILLKTGSCTNQSAIHVS